MPKLSFERRVPHAPERMFALVADLEDYPRFIPNCSAMSVRPAGEPDTVLAEMTIRFGPITQSYLSRVTLDREGMAIRAVAQRGLFRHLDSTWRFEPEGEGTLIRFDIDFKIANPLIAAVAEPAFGQKQDEIMNAFVAEASRRFASAP